MKALTFTIHLLEPVLVGQVTGGDPNSASSVPFIPGSVVRGALIGRYQRKTGKALEATDPAFRRMFLDGDTSFLNAYPLHRTGERMLPTPLSWRCEKDKRDPLVVYDVAIEKPPEVTLKTFSGDGTAFCHTMLEEGDFEEEVSVEFHSPARQVNIHTYREDRWRQRKGKDTVFRYESIAKGEQFGAVIVSEHEESLKRLCSLLETNSEFHLGKARTAGYGRVKIEEIHIIEKWQEYQLPGEHPLDSIVVTCLSDILLRNERGNYITNLDMLLGVKHQRAFVRTHVVGGFNHKWGLPLPQAQAIQAGSVYVYPQEDGLLTALRQLKAKGIGERRAEGFGRIAFNWQCHQKLQIKEAPSEKPLPVTLKGDSAKIASQMVDRMLRAELDKKLVACVNRMPVGEDSLPSNAQLSRLRRVVNSALAENNVELITEHLGNLTKTATSQIERCRIEGSPLDIWLQERADNPESVWDKLGIIPQQQSKLISIGKVHPDFDDALALEYTLRLIDAVLLKAMKEREE